MNRHLPITAAVSHEFERVDHESFYLLFYVDVGVCLYEQALSNPGLKNGDPPLGRLSTNTILSSSMWLVKRSCELAVQQMTACPRWPNNGASRLWELPTPCKLQLALFFEV